MKYRNQVKFKDQAELRETLNLQPAKNHMPKLTAKFKEIAEQESAYDDYNPMMTEKGTVDRAIEIENRLQQIAWERDKLEVKYQRILLQKGDTGIVQQAMDEIDAEWDDLIKEYRG